MRDRRGQCPDEHALAALLDRGASTDADRTLVEHAAGCEDCRRLIGGLSRASDGALPPVPAVLLAQAVKLGTAGTSPAIRRWWQAAAAAACVIAAVGLWRGSVPSPDADSSAAPAVSGAAASVDAVRGTGPTEPPRMLEPLANSTIGAAPVVFRWTPVEGAVQYRVQLLTSDGEVVWSEMTAETSIRFEQPLAGGAGRQYYAWVAAQLPDGRRLQSTIVRLTGQTR